MSNKGAFAITFRVPDNSRFSTHDLYLVLHTLQAHNKTVWWRVTFLDALGDQTVNDFCSKVEESRPVGVWISTANLLAVATKINQTIEAYMLAYPPSYDRESYDRENAVEDASLRNFKTSAVELGIEVIDDGTIIVITKSTADIGPLREVFGSILVEDLDTYLAH